MRQLQPRDLVWDGCLNVRDLGGLPTRDGGETRFGAIVRADSVRQLSDEGWQALVDHGIRTVIDLRGDHELAEDPPAELPVDLVHVPFMEADDAEWEEIGPELDAAVAAAPDVAAATRDVYLIFLERFRSNAAAAVRAVAAAPEGGIVIHCAGGKDRTGLLSAFLLHLAGVPADEIAADYALSEERLRPRHEKWFAAAETEEELERLRRISQTPAASMVGVFDELERRYGGVEPYLRGAGVTDEELELVRARLRG
ncbi:MAG TPA: tyrosine-protein phosphatase [Gaiellaceae bacterium]|nr:tyrosine-protein phosphatase [Gaiellaceae bacterium]